MTEEKVYPPFLEVYLYDPETGEFKESYNAQHSPLDDPGTYLCPIHHTKTAPPEKRKDTVAVFTPTTDHETGAWALVPDYRGHRAYHQESDSSIEVTKIGELPEGYALTRALKYIIADAATAKSWEVLQSKIAASYADVSVAVGKTENQWQVNQTSLALIESKISMVANGVITCPATWRNAKNVDVPITIDDLKKIATAAHCNIDAAHSHACELKEQLAAAVKMQDLNKLQAITW